MMIVEDVLEAVLRRDRRVVIVALGVVVAISWAYLLSGAGMGMSGAEMTAMSELQRRGEMSAMGMTTPATWTPAYAALMLLMWWIMMVAMMVPSAAPMILTFGALNRRQRAAEAPYTTTGVFAIGYLAVWAGFSTVAVGLQWSLQRTALLSPLLVGTNVLLGAATLLAAGIYQFTPAKSACLEHCRSPLTYFGQRWRRGGMGAFLMGIEHGAYCVGCCFFLMALLFVGGVMNLYWIFGIAVLVLIEKTVPGGHWIRRALGLVLIGWGGLVLATAV